MAHPQRHRPWRRRAPALAVALAIPAVGLGLRHSLGLTWSLEGLRGFVDGLGVWGPAAYVAVMAFRAVLLIPSQVVLLAGGLCFGAVGGTLYGGLGIWLSALALCALTRWVVGDEVRQRVPTPVQRALAAGGTRGAAGLLGLGTAYPFGALTAYHAAAGLTTMPFALFTAVVAAGALGRAWIWASFGSALVEGPTALALASGVVAAGLLLPLLHPRVRAAVRRHFAPEAPAPQPPPPLDTAQHGGAEGR